MKYFLQIYFLIGYYNRKTSDFPLLLILILQLQCYLSFSIISGVLCQLIHLVFEAIELYYPVVRIVLTSS